VAKYREDMRIPSTHQPQSEKVQPASGPGPKEDSNITADHHTRAAVEANEKKGLGPAAPVV